MKVLTYVTTAGRCPFREWLLSLSDGRAANQIRSRIDRLAVGNPGDCKALGSGLYEMRIHHGPGYRVYFGKRGPEIILLLCGGDKSTQRRDILKASDYWEDYKKDETPRLLQRPDQRS